MNLTKIMEHKDCPKELLDTFQKTFLGTGPYSGIVVFKDNIGGGSVVIATGDNDLTFSLPHSFTYHDVSDFRVRLEDENVKVKCRSSDLDKDLEFDLLVTDDEVSVLGRREIL